MVREQQKQQKLEHFISVKLADYFEQLEGKTPSRVYDMVINEAESAVIRHVVMHCEGNQSKAAKVLGISRGSLRNKMQKYDI